VQAKPEHNHTRKTTTMMDTPPKMPTSTSRRLLPPDDKNKGSHQQREEDDDVFTPPFEIIVNCQQQEEDENDEDDALEFSCSVLTAVTPTVSLNCDSNHANSRSAAAAGNCPSLASSLSSCVDLCSHNNNSHLRALDSSDEQIPDAAAAAASSRRRGPQRLQSARPSRNHRKGVMRWASMPSSSSHRCLRSSAANNNSHGYCSDSPGNNNSEQGPKLPRRRGSNGTFGTGASDDCTGGRGHIVDGDSHKSFGSSKKGVPRLPTRQKSSASLFSCCSRSKSSHSVAALAA
jgi:hypothetical protein